MNLLGAAHYDPAVAVSKATTAAIAMVALDTTNLRVTVVVPPSGRLQWEIDGGAIHGAATMPQIFLGVMAGATVHGRKAVEQDVSNLAATSLVFCRARGIITGLTPGASIVLDAAYGVETVVAATGYKYGGPNNTTANDAFGGVTFSVWDPSPVYTPAAGAAPTNTVHVKLDAVQADTDDLQTRLPAALVSGRIDASVGAMAAGVVTAAAVATGAIDADALATDAVAEIADGVWDEPIAGHLTAGSTGEKLNAAGAGGDPWSTAVPGAYGAGTAGNILGNRLDVAVSTRNAAAPLDAAGTRAAVGLAAANLDTQLDGLPTAAEIRAEMDTNSVDLNAIGSLVTSIDGKVDVAVSTRMATFTYTAPDNAGITAIKAKTDSLTFTVAGHLDINVLKVNGVTVIGTGAAGDRWRVA